MIFHIKKLYICVSWYFFVMMAWVIFSNKIETFLLCFFALIIHEAGHITTIYILKEKVNIFYILPLGFCCRLKNQNKISNEKMIRILLFGPVASFCAAGLFFWTKEFFIVNLMIGLFNLLPIGKLDGGRISKIIANT